MDCLAGAAVARRPTVVGCLRRSKCGLYPITLAVITSDRADRRGLPAAGHDGRLDKTLSTVSGTVGGPRGPFRQALLFISWGLSRERHCFLARKFVFPCGLYLDGWIGSLSFLTLRWGVCRSASGRSRSCGGGGILPALKRCQTLSNLSTLERIWLHGCVMLLPALKRCSTPV